MIFFPWFETLGYLLLRAYDNMKEESEPFFKNIRSRFFHNSLNLEPFFGAGARAALYFSPAGGRRSRKSGENYRRKNVQIKGSDNIL